MVAEVDRGREQTVGEDNATASMKPRSGEVTNECGAYCEGCSQMKFASQGRR